MTDINYIAAFLTLSCQLKCNYCINHHGHDLRARKQMSGFDWINGLNRLPRREDLPITLQGGEPSLHKDFYHIINGLNHPIDLLTNLEFDINDFMKNVSPERFRRNSPYASIRVSWHIGQNSGQELLDKVAEMASHGYSIGIWGIDHPETIAELREAQRRAWSMEIDFRIKEFLGEYNGKFYGTLRYPEAVTQIKLKSCQCRTKELLIDPLGFIFRCHSDLYSSRYQIGHIMDNTLPETGVWRSCNVYGLCNSCDIKVKTNRFQQYGYSAVDIILDKDWK